MNTNWHLYVIVTIDDFFYTGIAKDVDRRYEEHCGPSPRGSKFLRAHPPKKVVFSQAIGSRSLATKVERNFKRLTRKRKDSIVNDGILMFDPENGAIL